MVFLWGQPIWSNWAIVAIASVGAILAYKSLQQIRRQSRATEDAARAANTNALAVMNGERAWIMVRIDLVPGFGGPYTGQSCENGGTTSIETTALPVRLRYRNDGRTPGWIVQRRMWLLITDDIPRLPSYEGGKAESDLEPIGVAEEQYRDITVEADGRGGLDHNVIVYGVVDYRDIFGGQRQTSFGYRWRENTFSRDPELSEYNSST
jgi:hypothetical protein